ncbi:13602_t:CDS:2 [Funneliformis geosporum]|nr:13602_t:CDS:2 [Funneliformis geosporum]
MHLPTIQEMVVFEKGPPLYRQIYELSFMVDQSMRLPTIQESGVFDDGPSLYFQIYDLVSMVKNITITCLPIGRLWGWSFIIKVNSVEVAMYNVGNFAYEGVVGKWRLNL